MKLNSILIFCLFISFNAFCQKPKSIDEAITMLLERLDEESKTLFKDKEERDAVSDLHMSVGMGIRNGWIRHGERSLKDEFNKLGVGDPDTMSSIILTAAHRKLNGFPMDIEEQAAAYVEDMKVYREEEAKIIGKAVAHYNNNSVGEKIKIYYPLDSDSKTIKKAIIYPLLDWELIPGQYLVITGIITRKHFGADEDDVYFDLKITDMNYPGISVLGPKMKIGEEHTFKLKWLKIESVRKK